MQIALLHKHYSNDHLATVKTEMQKLGAPTVRAIWSETYGMWMAVEGCHRIRAAKDLGLTPIIKDISENKSVIMQIDEDNTRVSVSKLTQDSLWRTEHINFEDE